MDEQLKQGIALARAGKREQARAALMAVVEADERSELGWLWLSGVVDEPDDARVCLENVLAVNPENAQARQGLEWLNARYGVPSPPEGEPREVRALDDDPEPEPVVALLAHEPEPEPAPAPAAAPRLPADALAASAGDDPCPYCGAPTALGQRSCLRCKNSLMVRDKPRERRSVWLTILGWLWYLTAILTFLGTLAILAGAVVAFQSTRGTASQGTGTSVAIFVTTIGVVIAIFGGAELAVARGLMRRARWAYFTAIALSLIGTLGLLLQLAVSGAPPADPSAAASAAATRAASGVNVVIYVLSWLLLALSFRDFYGPLRRFQPSFRRTEHATHYNAGVAYKDRGMWYMAMREWEMAVERAPVDLNYLHALGLAYAQVGRFDRARETLDKALGVAPGHLQLSESRAIVEQMAQKAAAG